MQKHTLPKTSRKNRAPASTADQKFRPRRVAYPLRVAVVTVVAITLLAASFLAGRFIEAPPRDAIQSAQQSIDVWSAVESKVVDSRVTFTGRVQPGTDVSITVASEAVPNVVVRQSLAVGDHVLPGSLAGVVSGEPYIFLPGPLPLYRNVSFSDQGDDVLALQTALGSLGYRVEQDGVVGQATMNAAKDLFASAGYSLPASPVGSKNSAAGGTADVDEGKSLPPAPTALIPYIPFRQLLLLPVGGGVVATSAQVGAEITADTPLLTVRATPSYVEFITDVTQADLLPVGTKLSVRLDSKEFLATVEKIGAFQEGKEGTKPGKPIALAPTEPGGMGLPVGQAATITTVGETEESLSVPLIAVREDAAGHYVTRQSSAGGTQNSGAASPMPAAAQERVNIRVLRTGGGYAAISADLRAGDKVKVS